jgi:single-stranded DNA-specific DHH superfamily exonuclease
MLPEKIIGKPDTRKIERWLGAKGRKLLVYHRDADGVCSAAILMKFFPDFITVSREGPIIDSRFFRDILSRKPDLLVFLDMPIDQEWKKITKLADTMPALNILILDHHLPEKDMNGPRIIHVNPMFQGKTYIPASCVIYQLFRKMGYAVKSVAWISIIGIIGDYGMKDCHWMIDEYRQYLRTHAGPSCSELQKASEILASAITLRGAAGAEKALKILSTVRRYDDMKKSEDLKKWNIVVQRETKKIVNDFEKNKETAGERVIFYEIKSRMNITSIIATITAERYPDCIVIIRKRAGDLWKISLRYQEGGLSVGDMAKYASNGIGSGGGHVKSAGAVVNDWKEFRKRVMEYVA